VSLPATRASTLPRLSVRRRLRGDGAATAVQDAATRLSLGATFASRAVVWAAALGALAIFGANQVVRANLDAPALTQPFYSHAINFLLAPGARYDSVWYLGIAHHGYFSRQSSAFFPLLPLLLSGGEHVFGSPLVVGLIVSLGSCLVALQLLYRLALLDLGERAARTSVLLLAFFPTALFLSAVYTESLFLALSVGAVYAARRGRWPWAAVLAALASGTRSSGVLLLVPLVAIWIGEARRRGRDLRWRTSLPWLALVPAGLLAYMGYLWVTHNAPLAPFQSEVFWDRSFAGPFGAVWDALRGIPDALRLVLTAHQEPFAAGSPFGWQAYQLLDLPFLAFAAAGLWLCWRRLPRAYTAYAAILLAQALSYPVPSDPLKSFSRYTLVIFPLFLGWGAMLGEHPRARKLTLGLSGLGLVGCSMLWGVWLWVA
jgi:hypothetical protein